MCGRYTSTSAPADLAKVFAVDEVKVDELPLRYNVAPTQDVYAVAERRPKEDGESPRRQLGAFRWGLVPYWAKDPSAGNKMINARAEGIETKNAYKRALTRRRCIIPADAFYEWQVREGDAKGKAKKKNKLPYVIRHKDGSPLAFAGLWEFWRPKDQPDAEPIRSCVIITTAANDLVAPIHDRMPVILPPEAWDQWLDPANENLSAIQGLLVPAPSADLEAYPVEHPGQRRGQRGARAGRGAAPAARRRLLTACALRTAVGARLSMIARLPKSWRRGESAGTRLTIHSCKSDTGPRIAASALACSRRCSIRSGHRSSDHSPSEAPSGRCRWRGGGASPPGPRPADGRATAPRTQVLVDAVHRQVGRDRSGIPGCRLAVPAVHRRLVCHAPEPETAGRGRPVEPVPHLLVGIGCPKRLEQLGRALLEPGNRRLWAVGLLGLAFDVHRRAGAHDVLDPPVDPADVE